MSTGCPLFFSPCRLILVIFCLPACNHRTLGKDSRSGSSRLNRYKWGAGAFFLKHISELAALAFWVRHYRILIHGERLSIEEDVESTNCGILVSIENCGRRLSEKKPTENLLTGQKTRCGPRSTEARWACPAGAGCDALPVFEGQTLLAAPMTSDCRRCNISSSPRAFAQLP